MTVVVGSLPPAPGVLDSRCTQFVVSLGVGLAVLKQLSFVHSVASSVVVTLVIITIKKWN